MAKETTSEKNKRIAKNTLLLYFRMLIVMAVSLYTSRLVLQALGVVDYGINNVVSGFVSLFSLFSASISTAISRFLTIELGREDKIRLKHVFSASLTILIILCGVIVVIAEPIGLWFLYHKMVIPMERLSTAHWIFQLALLRFCVNLLSVPYNASIISHEKMGVFAYISIIDVMLKVLIVAALFVIPFDKLLVLAILDTIVAIILRMIYAQYCLRHFSECKYYFFWDKPLIKEIFSLTGWNFIGATAAVTRDQGGNILMNMFGGPVVNAARGISLQVNNAVSQFASNFITALNPQIIKSYATSDTGYLYTLLYRGSRFSYYLLFILSLPLLICTQYVLNLWLGIVPEYSVIFVRLALLVSMIDSITNALTTGILATGKVKYYQITVGGMLLLNIPVSYLFLKLGMTPVVVMWVSLAISLACMTLRILFVKKLLGMEILAFFKHVCGNCMFVSLVSMALPLLLYSQMGCEDFVAFVILGLTCLISSTICVLFLGCTVGERALFLDKAKSMFVRFYGKNRR